MNTTSKTQTFKFECKKHGTIETPEVRNGKKICPTCKCFVKTTKVEIEVDVADIHDEAQTYLEAATATDLVAEANVAFHLDEKPINSKVQVSGKVWKGFETELIETGEKYSVVKVVDGPKNGKRFIGRQFRTLNRNITRK